MIKLEHTEVLGWEHAIRGMRNPMNSWEKSDSGWNAHIPPLELRNEIDWDEYAKHYISVQYDAEYEYDLGPNDRDLMKRLRNAGTDHRKFMRMITVYVDITGPLYWWKEFDTYKVGTVANSCSTMHKIAAKEFTLEDFSCEHLNDQIMPGVCKIMSPLDVLYATIDMLNACRSAYISLGNGDEKKQYWWQMIQLLPSSYNQKRTIMLNYEVLANIYKSRKDHKLDEWHEFCDWIESLPYSEIITGQERGFTSKEMVEIGEHLQKGFQAGMNNEFSDPVTPKEAWPSTPEEVAKALEEWDKIVEKIQNAVITSLDDFKKELGIESPSKHDKG